MSRILIYGGSAMVHNYSFIAPMRIIRALKRHGHFITLINWADQRIPKETLKEGVTEHSWGTCYTYDIDEMIRQLLRTINNWKPDLIYSMGTTHIGILIKVCKQYKIPLGLHGGDPYYAKYPNISLIDYARQCDFITMNEGQAWNYINCTYPDLKSKCYLLNHAIDPELAPTLEEVEKCEKKYICSIVGGDDRIRRRELLLYFYQWTDKFPEYKFGTGGSMTKGATQPYLKEDLVRVLPNLPAWNTTTFTDEEIVQFTGKKFNLTWIPNDLVYPLGLSHKAVHELYTSSYFGFCPYGHYLCKGWQSEYNVLTFGTKSLEMIGSGAGLIANRIKDIEKIIIHGKTGWILDKPEDGYKALKWAIDNPKDAKQMGIEAYKFAHKYHSWNNRYFDVLVPIFKKLGLKV